MGDHKTTGTQPESNSTSQVGTHGNADAGDRMDQVRDPSQRQGQTKGSAGQGSTSGSQWSDQQPGYAGGTKDEGMTRGDSTSRPQPDGTTPLEHEGRPKA